MDFERYNIYDGPLYGLNNAFRYKRDQRVAEIEFYMV